MVDHPEHLPQLRFPDVTYSVTYRLDDQSDRLSPAEGDLVARNMEHFNEQRYRLAAYVVMDDHVHVVVCPFTGYDLGSILHSWKSYTSKEINLLRGAGGTRWMKDNYTRIIRHERELRATIQYIIDNPRRRWPEITDYRWLKVFPVL